jgi:hypothetical protein
VDAGALLGVTRGQLRAPTLRAPTHLLVDANLGQVLRQGPPPLSLGALCSRGFRIGSGAATGASGVGASPPVGGVAAGGGP